MKVLICGDRNWTDCNLVYMIVDFLQKRYGPIIVIEGEAKGADTCAKVSALKLGIDFMGFPANWTKFGRAAGPIRNNEMQKEKPQLVLGFHDDIEVSKGTKDMLDKSSQVKDVAVILVSHSKEKDRLFNWEWYSEPVKEITLNTE